MGRKSFAICAGIIAVVMGIMLYLNFWWKPAPNYEWTEIIEMANQKITWEGAGYDGIYTRKAEGPVKDSNEWGKAKNN